jgi:4-hydroxyacetophenone monooxygenase
MELSEALEGATLVPLLAAIAHLTGEIDLLDRYASTPLYRFRNPVVEPPSLVAEVRALARTALEGHTGRRPDPLSSDRLLRIATFCAGEPVDGDYAELIRAESNFGQSRRAVPRQIDRRLHAVVIGAGLAGVCAAIRLRQSGVACTVFDKNDGIGGTWWENNYPNLRVDVPSQFYSYSFAPNASWSSNYSLRGELQTYVESCASDHGVRNDIHLRHEVLGAAWDSVDQRWIVRVQPPTGPEIVVGADILVSAVGMLNRPYVPEIAGLDAFAGPWFHSARWPRDLDITGRRVAVVGTGASAVQLVPGIAPMAARVDVFQRSRHWLAPNPTYLREVHNGERWLLHHVPYYAGWVRFLLFWNTGDRLYPAYRVDPDWPTPERSISGTNEKLRVIMTNHLRDQLDGDENLIGQVLPEYAPFGKRILQDGGWFAALRRENVDLVAQPIDHVTSNGVVTADGILHEADVLVLATGFYARKFLWPMEIRSDRGRLEDVWGDRPRAHLGMTVPGFPNLFCLYGPNTNPVAGSVIFMLECQIDYLLGSVDLLLTGEHASIEVRQEASDEYNALLDAELDRMVWRHPGVSSYYNNADGQVVTNCPWRLVDYWAMTRQPDPSLHVLRSVARSVA